MKTPIKFETIDGKLVNVLPYIGEKVIPIEAIEEYLRCLKEIGAEGVYLGREG